MAEIASLAIEAKFDQLKQATAALREMPAAASAAERAAQRWGVATTTAARSTEDFSRRVQGTIRSLEFERQQLGRTTAEQAKYAALRRAGVSAASAEGQAIMASVAALQAQRAATTSAGGAAKVATAAASGLVTQLKAVAAAYIGVQAAQTLWNTAMSAGDLGEQAEQIGVNTDQLQAYRLAGAQAGIVTEQMDTALTKLAKSMGSAADGNKEMVERFQQLGVKLLDANGQLRPVADVMPEVAKGALAIGSSSQRTATLMDLFGRSGAKMATVLEELAKGNDHVIASARQENAIISSSAIAAWDTLGDRLTVTRQKWATLIGEFGATYALPAIEHLNGLLESTKKELEGIASLWKWIMGNMGAAARRDVQASVAGPAQADVKNLQDRLDALRQNPSQFGFKASEKALTDQIAARQEALNRAQALANQSIFQMDEADARRDRLPVSAPPLGANVSGPPSVGAGSPAVKGAGDAAVKAYQKVIDSAKDYIATKNAETQAIGMSVQAAAQLKHETELLSKASNDNTVLGAAQVTQLKALAASMAEADARFANASFMDEATRKSEEFIQQQQIERDTLWMSAEAADAYRIAQGYLNDAKARGIELSDAEKAKLQELATAQAAAAEATRNAKEIYDTAKSAFQGFFADMRQGLMDGKSVWETFGNAAFNALDKIAGKLLEMATAKLFESAFGGGPGSSNAGGGWIMDLLGAVVGGAAGGGNVAGGSGTVWAKGGAFQAGNVIPFASGGIVSSPTMFPMAGGRRGVMGEAGPEGILPLHRGRDGGLGVRMSGGGATVIRLEVSGDNEWVRAVARDETGKIVAVVGPKIEGSAVKKANRAVPSMVAADHRDRGGDHRL